MGKSSFKENRRAAASPGPGKEGTRRSLADHEVDPLEEPGRLPPALVGRSGRRKVSSSFPSPPASGWLGDTSSLSGNEVRWSNMRGIYLTPLRKAKQGWSSLSSHTGTFPWAHTLARASIDGIFSQHLPISLPRFHHWPIPKTILVWLYTGLTRVHSDWTLPRRTPGKILK